MGNSFACFVPNERKWSGSQRPQNPPSIKRPTSLRTGTVPSSSSEKESTLHDDPIIHQQALAMALLFREQHGSLFHLDRATSLKDPLQSSKKQKKFPRSSSSRPPSLADPVPQPHQLMNQDLKIDGLETKHFVLVHGGGFGAWCWYRTIAHLKESGFEVDAVDLTGSGIHSCDTNSIRSLAQYAKPLLDLLEKLGDGKKVILVGHDFGGTCVSYAMELFPSKVSKAIFVAAAMLKSGQRTLDIFSQQTSSNDLMRNAQIFLYANGKDQPPTAIDLDKKLLEDFLFNQSPAKDVALASVSMRPIPFAPATEKLSLSKAKYGSIQRFYIKTEEDCAIPVPLQESMITLNPPEQVFQLKGSDHSPFFSRPQALHRLLVDIAKIPSRQF